MLGIKIFVILVEYQFIVIEFDFELQVYCVVGNFEYFVLCDVDVKWYVCEECGGWIFGLYECNVFVCFEYGVLDSFCVDLFLFDFDWIEEEYMLMIYCILLLEMVGLKDDFNGLICYMLDGNLLVGFVFGLWNMWLVEGFSFGIIVVGGIGYYLVQMMVEGEVEIDMVLLDFKCYGSWMIIEYGVKKNEECYEYVYILYYLDEECEVVCFLCIVLVYDCQKVKGV